MTRTGQEKEIKREKETDIKRERERARKRKMRDVDGMGIVVRKQHARRKKKSTEKKNYKTK